jgi:hypothetical protein
LSITLRDDAGDDDVDDDDDDLQMISLMFRGCVEKHQM